MRRSGRPLAQNVNTVSNIHSRHDPFAADYGLWPFDDTDYDIVCPVTKSSLKLTCPCGLRSSLRMPVGKLAPNTMAVAVTVAVPTVAYAGARRLSIMSSPYSTRSS